MNTPKSAVNQTPSPLTNSTVQDIVQAVDEFLCLHGEPMSIPFTQVQTISAQFASLQHGDLLGVLLKSDAVLLGKYVLTFR